MIELTEMQCNIGAAFLASRSSTCTMAVVFMTSLSLASLSQVTDAFGQAPDTPRIGLGLGTEGVGPVAEAGVSPPPFTTSTWGMAGITPKDCEYYENVLGYRGFVALRVPPACATLYPNLFGLRPALANVGIGLQSETAFSYTYDLRGHNRTPQEYGGQKPTLAASTLVQMTYDLSRIGFTPGAQLDVQGVWQVSNFAQANPYILGIGSFAVDQPLLDGRLDLRYGLMTLASNYYGLAIGGIAFGNAQGPISIIPHEVGLAFETAVPGIEAIVRPFKDRNWYTNFSVSEATGKNEIDDNRTGLRIRVPGSRGLVANELGYGGAQEPTWLRFGSIYNFTPQTTFKNNGTAKGNYDYYAGITYQVTGRGDINHGLFIDLKGDLAPQNRNFYANDIALTVSYRGLPKRPFDTFSLGFQYLAYSKDLRESLMQIEHQGLPANSNAFTASYAMFLQRGLFFIPTLSYLTQPVGVTRPSPGALSLTATLAFAL